MARPSSLGLQTWPGETAPLKGSSISMKPLVDSIEPWQL
jgi:hypothetical protein